MSGFRHSALSSWLATRNQKFKRLFYLSFVKIRPLPRVWHGHCVKLNQNTRTQDCFMKLKLGKRQLVLELDKPPFARFHGQAGRMRLLAHQPTA
jgi:hypothetical protein